MLIEQFLCQEGDLSLIQCYSSTLSASEGMAADGHCSICICILEKCVCEIFKEAKILNMLEKQDFFNILWPNVKSKRTHCAMTGIHGKVLSYITLNKELNI